MITRMGLGEGGEGEWKGGTLGRGRECRVGVLGEPGVGKNALIARFVRGEFPRVRQQLQNLINISTKMI